MPRPKKPVKLPKALWIVFERMPDGSIAPSTGSIYVNPNDIGDVFD